MTNQNRESEPEKTVLFYGGPISMQGYAQICEICDKIDEPSEDAILVLATYGGDPHAGFRIARALQHYFPKGFRLLVPDQCKSAGTLVAIGASELVIADRGELGPLDIQVAKQNELFESSSGLDLPQSITAVTADAIQAFKEALVNSRLSYNLSTKISGELATKLVVGLFSPIYAQIDPIKLGEHQRANFIGHEYGKRLSDKSGNLKRGAIMQLVSGYPSHGFVIDRKEAKELFHKVDKPTEQECQAIAPLYKALESVFNSPVPMVSEITDVYYKGSNDEREHQDEANEGVSTAPSGVGSNEGTASEVEQTSTGNG